VAKSKAIWFGWVTFAAVMLAVVGIFNVFEGLVALLRDDVAFVNGNDLVVVNLTGWGILLLIFGGLLIAAGIGLLARNQAARITAIVVIGLHALAQISVLGAYPVWSILMIALDVVILFALTVHWSESKPQEEPPPAMVGAHRANRVDTGTATVPAGGPPPSNVPGSPAAVHATATPPTPAAPAAPAAPATPAAPVAPQAATSSTAPSTPPAPAAPPPAAKAEPPSAPRSAPPATGASAAAGAV
jgi:hypothetical protein